MKLATLSLLLLPLVAPAADPSCQATITSDVQAVVASLSAVTSQAKAQQLPEALEQLAKDFATVLPSLSQPDQVLVEKFLTDLEAALSPSGPGGTAITATERLRLTNDLTQVLLSTGLTTAQAQLILDDIAAVFTAVEGISTAQLKSDLQRLATDLQACRIRS